MNLNFKISDYKMLASMARLSGHDGNPKHEIDLFLTTHTFLPYAEKITDIVMQPCERKPFAEDLENIVSEKAREVSKGWPFVKPVSCVYMEDAQLDLDGKLVLPTFERRYDKMIAGRVLRQAGQKIPLEIATGAFGMILANACSQRWLLFGARARWTADIGGPIQFVGVGSLEELDYEQRLFAEIREETGILRDDISEIKLLGFSGSLKYWFDTGIDYAVRTKVLRDVKQHETFRGMLKEAGGYEELNLPKLTGASAQKFEEFGPVLDLGQKSKEHKRVFGLPIAKLKDAYVDAGLRTMMASYTRMQTARWLVDSELQKFIKAAE